MNLNSLHLLLTYRCTSECDHCFVYCSPYAPGTMTIDQVQDAIQQAARLESVSSVYFEGGEPFLYYPIMLQGIKLAHELNLEVGIVTNGYFATTLEDALIWLEPLRQSGDISLSISIDGYHQHHTAEAESGLNVLKAAEQLGFRQGQITIDPPCGVEDAHHPGQPILGGGVRFRGRAVDKLVSKDLPVKSWQKYPKCPDEDWEQLGRLHLDPYGNLFACQGIIVGNLNQQNLRQIVETWRPGQHPIIAALHTGGPAQLVREFNLDLSGTYHDACHLCFLARRELSEQHPELLGPAQVYGEF